MEKMEGKTTIIDEWRRVEIPSPPEINAVSLDPHVTAYLILDIQRQNCGQRPRCMASIPKIKGLLSEARDRKMLVVYSLIRNSSADDIITDVAPLKAEPVVQAGADKFFRTDLEKILVEKATRNVVLVGTAAHGAILHTAAGAAMRGFEVIVPVDGMSSSELYSEQYTAWHLVNSPGTRNQTTLTKFDLISFS